MKRFALAMTALLLLALAANAAQYTLTERTIDTDNRIPAVRTIFSILLLKDSEPDGNLDDAPAGLSVTVAEAYFDEHYTRLRNLNKIKVDVADVQNPTNQELAICVFAGIRDHVTSPHISVAANAQAALNDAAMDAAKATAETEGATVVGEEDNP